jgi:hypothetical protein
MQVGSRVWVEREIPPPAGESAGVRDDAQIRILRFSPWLGASVVKRSNDLLL